MKKRLLILSASIGAGHAKAGEALSQEYSKYFNGEAHHLDFLRYASPLFSRWIEETYYLMTKHTPSIYRLLYQMADRPHSSAQKSEIIIGLRKYRDLIREYRPHAIISTHFFPAAVVSYMYPHFSVPNGVVLTDYISHHIWVNPNTNLYFIAHDGMTDELKQLGVETAKIRSTGIPIRPAFAQDFNRLELQKKFNLDSNQPTFLVMSGGNAIGPLVDIIKTLGKFNDNVQIIAVTGRNQKTFLQLQELFNELKIKGQVLGYVDNIHEYMAISDLLISKAGGLTVSEALSIGLPMAIIQPTPGQEDGNTNFLINTGSGVYLKNIKDLAQLTGKLVENPLEIKKMNSNALKYSKPDAAKSILAEMDRLITKKKNHNSLAFRDSALS